MIKFLNDQFNQLSHLGILKSHTENQKKHIILSNKIALACILNSAPYFFIFHFFNLTIPSLIVIPTVCAYALAFWLNKKYYFNTARILIIFATSITLIILSCLFGNNTADYLYFSLIPLVFILFPDIFSKLQVLATLIPMSFGFLAKYLSQVQVIPLYSLDTTLYTTLSYLGMGSGFILIYSFVLIFKQQINTAENELYRINETLKMALIESKKRKLQLEKASQQAAFTRLTMGISHEIRNPMASMLTRSEIVEQAPENVAGVLKFTGIIKQNIKRILNITETMLKYGNPTSHKKENVSIVALIKEILDLTENKMKNNKIKVNTKFLDSQLIYADPIRLHQAFLNILLNAIESMSQNGGTLTIKTKQIEQYIVLTITDEGIGMTEEERNQIFDPFYTTKYENTGLGMSITLRCIDENKGLITCESKKNVGTTFTISFPVLS